MYTYFQAIIKFNMNFINMSKLKFMLVGLYNLKSTSMKHDISLLFSNYISDI